jgi:eukaryotic-like serine/threonine-protein kinase
VYSLGATLYAMLTARPPFQGSSALEILRQVSDRDPIRPSAMHARVDGELETICLKCLEKDPTGRYGSAEGLADDLDRWLRREPILARPVALPEKVWLWCRRKPAVAFLIALVHLIGIVGLTGIVSQWQRAETEKAEARHSLSVAERSLYARDMILAFDSLNSGNLGHAWNLLSAHVPQPGQEDQRGWEWRYLRQECQGDQAFTWGDIGKESLSLPSSWIE